MSSDSVTGERRLPIGVSAAPRSSPRPRRRRVRPPARAPVGAAQILGGSLTSSSSSSLARAPGRTRRTSPGRHLHVRRADHRLAVVGLRRGDSRAAARTASALTSRAGAAHALGGGGRGLAGGGHDPCDRRAGEQQHAGQQQEHEEDVRAGGREQLGRHPEQGLAHEAAVVLEVGGVEEAVARRCRRGRGRASRRPGRASGRREADRARCGTGGPRGSSAGSRSARRLRTAATGAP